MVAGAAGLLTASALVVGFAPQLGTHALMRPPTLGAAAPTVVDASPTGTGTPTTTPSATPTRTPSESSDTSFPASSDDGPDETPEVTAPRTASVTSVPRTAGRSSNTPNPNSTKKPGARGGGHDDHGPGSADSVVPTSGSGRLGLVTVIPTFP